MCSCDLHVHVCIHIQMHTYAHRHVQTWTTHTNITLFHLWRMQPKILRMRCIGTFFVCHSTAKCSLSQRRHSTGIWGHGLVIECSTWSCTTVSTFARCALHMLPKKKVETKFVIRGCPIAYIHMIPLETKAARRIGLIQYWPPLENGHVRANGHGSARASVSGNARGHDLLHPSTCTSWEHYDLSCTRPFVQAAECVHGIYDMESDPCIRADHGAAIDSSGEKNNMGHAKYMTDLCGWMDSLWGLSLENPVFPSDMRLRRVGMMLLVGIFCSRRELGTLWSICSLTRHWVSCV